MPPRAKIYLHCAVGTGLFLLIDGLSQFAANDVPQFVAVLAVAMLSAMWKFKVPGIPVSFSTTFAFVLIGIANFSLGEALVIGCGSTLLQSLWRPIENRATRKVFFNIAGVTIAATFAYNPAHFELSRGLQSAPGMLALAALVYFAMNTALVAGIVSLIEDEPFSQVWRRLAKYSLPYYVAGGLIATVMIVASRLWDWRLGLLVVPVLYLTYRSYCFYLRRRRAVVMP